MKHRSPIDIAWHIPEAEWHDATLTLNDETSPGGMPVVCWQIDTGYDGASFRSDWSSDSDRSSRALERRARIRVRRHDGPVLIAVRVIDERGEHFTSLFSRNRR